jgi:hypothetical protein
MEFSEIIEPIDRQLLKSELTPEIFVRPTNNLNNEIYIFNGNEKPNLLLEIGRLRELSFRAAGGGTGKSCDLDEFDQGPYAYQQIAVWNPEKEEIVGAYRFVRCIDNQDSEGNFHLSTTEILEFSEKLKTAYFPSTIELGRSFVQPMFQPSAENKQGLFSLDNLWDGLGALVVDNPDIRYFFGKITMYSDFQTEARDLILSFMHHYFPDRDSLVRPYDPLLATYDCQDFLNELKQLDYKEGFKLLNSRVRALGENVPPLFSSYMNLSPSMKTFGTALNDHFGYVEETGVMVTIDDIYPSKKERHIQSYLEYKASLR